MQAHTDLHDIPESIQIVILLFYYNTIESTILSNEERDKLLTLFDEHNKFKDLEPFSFNLLYKCSRDGWNEKNFKNKCHGIPNLLVIIHNDKDIVFGGYTSTGWSADKSQSYSEYGSREEDTNAFLFCIRNNNDDHLPKIFNASKDHGGALRNQKGYYCMFGFDCAIWVFPKDFAANVGSTSYYTSYSKVPKKYYFIAGQSNNTKVMDIEVFSLH